MNHRLRLHLIVLLTFAGVDSARALEWDKTLISTVPEPGVAVVRTKFEYKNSSKKIVHLLEVKTSCGCTEATPDSSKIAPGESGAVYVLFTIGKRTGLQEKEITVLADDSNVPTRLKLKITLPAADTGIAAPAK
jgi:hypothetical protein